MSQPPPIPIPVQPLYYSMPPRGRPGGVTAIGVLSIVLGCFGILASCGGFAMTRGFMGFAAARSAAMSRSSSTTMTSTGGGSSSTFSASAGASSSNGSAGRSANSGASANTPPAPTPAATATADGLALLEPITTAQRDQLLAMIADRGDWYLGGPNDAGAWTPQDMAKLVKSHGQLTASPGEAHPGFYFLLADGRLELHDDYATYHGNGLDPLTVREVVQPGGNYSVATTQGGTTGPQTFNYRMSGSPMPPIKFSKGVLGISLAMSGLNVALALVLIVAGAMTLRGSRIGRTLHMIYAMIKLPLAITGAVIGAMMMSPIFASAGGANPAAIKAMVVGIAIASATIPAIYPIVLLIVMQVRSVKEWFAKTV
jgi:hypothetical protein